MKKLKIHFLKIEDMNTEKKKTSFEEVILATDLALEKK
jgi:recombinational DNA repair protein RecR